MNVSSPHYLLFPDVDGDGGNGRWRFVLRAVDGSSHLEAEDIESDTGCERLELLSIVRGLEALDQPSRVTLITTSNYVREGIRRGVIEWRENGWRWERFGQMVPVKNQDLWQRVDRAMRFHQIDCRVLRFDTPHTRAVPHREEGGPGVERRRIDSGTGFERGATAADRERFVAVSSNALEEIPGLFSPRHGLRYQAERFASALFGWVVAGLRGLWLRATP